MIVSRYLSEPYKTPPLPLSGSDPARPFSLPFRSGREPFQRLKFWTVHPLVHRLAPYEATAAPSFFTRCSWGTLVYWSQLLDVPEASKPEYAGSLTAYTSDLFMASDIQYLNEINAAKLVQLSAEPFSD